MLAIVYVLRSGEVTFITAPYRRRVVWVSLREGRRERLASMADAPAGGVVGVQTRWGRAAVGEASGAPPRAIRHA